jgi:hypothetical protein
VLPVPAQVKRIELALANGTLASITPAAHPHLWRAAQVGQPAHLRAPAVTMSIADAQRGRGFIAHWQRAAQLAHTARGQPLPESDLHACCSSHV